MVEIILKCIYILTEIHYIDFKSNDKYVYIFIPHTDKIAILTIALDVDWNTYILIFEIYEHLHLATQYKIEIKSFTWDGSSYVSANK